jgi:hypothetical protein
LAFAEQKLCAMEFSPALACCPTLKHCANAAGP